MPKAVPKPQNPKTPKPLVLSKSVAHRCMQKYFFVDFSLTDFKADNHIVLLFIDEWVLIHNESNIINNASEIGIVGAKNLLAYGAAKGGVVQMTKGLALDLATTCSMRSARSISSLLSPSSSWNSQRRLGSLTHT